MSAHESQSLLDIKAVSDLQKASNQSTAVDVFATEMSLAAALELRCWTIASPSVYVHAESSALWKMFQLVGWQAGSEFTRVQDRDVVLQRLPTSSDDNRWTAVKIEFTSMLKQHGFGADLSRRLTGAVAELTNNVWEHSERPDSGLLAFQVRNRSFSLTIADLGVGVLKSLRTKKAYRDLRTHAEALDKALLAGISRFDDPSRGFGFVDFLSVLTEFHGIARLRTGDIALTIDRRTEIELRHRDYLASFPGLQLSLKVALL